MAADIDWMFFFYGYTTGPGWAHSDRKFQWELRDTRGQVVAWITDEAVCGMMTVPLAQRWVVGRFGCRLPALDRQVVLPARGVVQTGVLNPRIILPSRPGDQVAVECPAHGPMAWQAMAWRCGSCPAVVTEADLGRLARWLGGDNLGADCGR